LTDCVLVTCMHVGLSVQKLLRVLKLGHLTLTTLTFDFWGHFVVHWIVHVLTDVCTKYEVSLLAVPKI